MSETTKTATPSHKLNRLEKRWILYDVACSAYTLLATALLSFYFNFLNPSDNLVSVWSLTNVIVTVIAVVLCPFLGTFADFSQKKKIFILLAASGIVGCYVLSVFSFFPKWTITGILFLLVYILTEASYTSANVFYDSMLSDVTTEEKMHNVSTNGYAWGYIGSCLPFALCLVVYVLGWKVFPQYMGLAFSVCCVITATWWMLFTLPLAKHYKQIHFLQKPEKPFRETFVRLGGIFKELAKNKKALIFLLAYFFYIDGVHTIIKMAMTIGSSLGFDVVKLVIALFVTQIVAFPCAILFGKLSAKFSCSKLLIVCISSYLAIGIFIVFLCQEWQFWLLAVAIGGFQGAVQALSRSYFTKIIPAEKSGECFGIYDIFGKSAAILGLGLIGLLDIWFPLAESTFFNVSLSPLPLLFSVGLILFIVSLRIPNTSNRNGKLEE